jgi:spermidine synthase
MMSNQRGNVNIVYLLLFTSGFSSLIYQIFFTRLFNITFGLFIHSTVVVVATYMLGLALGYYIAKFIRTNNYLLVYGYAELFIGIYSLIVFLLFPVIDNFYTLIGNSVLEKSLISILILLFPTTLMGITIPVVVKYVDSITAGGSIGKVYGFNSLGASLGVLFASMVLLNIFGLVGAFVFAFILNILIFASVVYLANGFKLNLNFAKSGFRFVDVGGWGFLALVFGFSGMALEMLWYRLMVYLIANNTFSFSIIVSVIILGIALGSILYKPIVSVLKTKFSNPNHMLLIVVSLFTSLYLMLSILILNSSYQLFGGLYHFFGNIFFGVFGDTKFSETMSLFFTRYTFVLITAGVIAFSSGLVVPLLFDIIKGETNKDENSISGTILAWNTIGSILGVVLMVYVFIPLLGFGNSFLVISLLYAFSGIVVLLVSYRKFLVPFAFGAIAFVALILLLPRDVTFTRVYNGFLGIKGEPKFYKEGLYGTILVTDVGNVRFMKINGIDEVPNDYDSLLTFKVLGNIAPMMKTNYTNVMLNALGGGITLSSLLHHVSNHSVFVVDICPDVRDALVFYSNQNYNVFSRSNWVFVPDDGRNFLKSYKGVFNLIIADATHPASADSWMLFTREFYEIVNSKLSEDGVFVQWVPLHNLAVYDFVSIIKTFRSVFKNTFIMITGIYTVFVGVKGDLNSLKFESKDFEDLSLVEVDDELKLKSIVFLTPRLIDRLIRYESGEVLSDFKSSVEFAEFHRRVAADTKKDNISMILKYADVREISSFTGAPLNLHSSMILSMKALLEYWDYTYYDALKNIDNSLLLYSDNFYSKYLFSVVFPEFVKFLYNYGDYIKEKYGLNVYMELLNYASNKMNGLERGK